MPDDRRQPFQRLPHLLLGAGGLTTAVALAAMAVAREPALDAWLAATMLWSGLPIGALGFLMMMHLISGIWDDELMVQMEGAVLLLPLAALAFVPLLLGTDALFHWVGQAQETPFRRVYLSETFLVVRTLVALALLALLAVPLVLRRGLSVPVAAVGLVLYPILTSVLAVDWLMTLDSHFHSSIFGLYVLSIQMCVALTCAAMLSLSDAAGVRAPGVVGGLMLTAVLVWAYMSFMQFFIVWSGNLPPGVTWYLTRGEPPWPQLFWAVALLHAVPAFLLLLMPVLARPRVLMVLAGVVLLGKALEIAWLVLPAGQGEETLWLAAVLFVAAVLGLGGLFGGGLILAFRRRARARAPRKRKEAT